MTEAEIRRIVEIVRADLPHFADEVQKMLLDDHGEVRTASRRPPRPKPYYRTWRITKSQITGRGRTRP